MLAGTVLVLTGLAGAAPARGAGDVNVGEISDLTGCGTELPPPGIVDHWLHYGPLLIPGRSGGAAPPADATLTVPPAAPRPAGATLTITLYFARAGSVILRLPISHA